jgi:hypothetical protein
MKQRFSEVSEVMVIREYDIPDEDIIEVFGSELDFTTALEEIHYGRQEISDLPSHQAEFISELGCNYDAEQIGEPYWVGADRGNIEAEWVFED